MITLGREFITPNEAFPCADEVLAEAADHSTEIDVAHYAVVHGSLPRLSNNTMELHRWLAKEWSSLLGIGPNPPPEALSVVRMNARATKHFDPNAIALQVSELVADTVMNRLEQIGLTPDAMKKLTGAADAQTKTITIASEKQSAAVKCELASVLPPSSPPLFPSSFPDEVSSPSPPSTSVQRLNARQASSSSIGNPFESASWGSATASRPTGQDGCGVPAIPSGSSSPTPPSSVHIFMTKPGTPPAKSSSSLESMILQLAWRKRAVPRTTFLSDSPRPSKRMRQETTVHGRLSVVIDDQMEFDLEEEEEEEEKEEEEEEEASDTSDTLGGFIIHDTPTPSNRSSRDSDCLTRGISDYRLRDEPSHKENIRHAIRTLVGNPGVREKSEAQMQGILLVMRGRQDAVITMRTGDGKSMLWLVPVMLQDHQKFIVVCPFTVLLKEQCDKAQSAGIRAVMWSSSSAIPPGVQILFVQVEQISSSSFSR